jgi:SAM-dependent methyltransferase
VPFARRVDILKNHAAMFGYWSCLRASLAALIGPAYSRNTFDRRYGTDTGILSLIDSRIPSEAMAEAVDYEPANVDTLHHVFRSLPFRLQDFHLLDIGCGKGRTLMVGALYPFRAVTGIELSPVTAGIARQNIDRFEATGRPLSRPVVRCENGTDFEVPDGNLFCVLYNPFVGRTFERCIEHLHGAARGREVWLAYINPWDCEEWLLDTGYFERVADYRVIPRTWAWNLWRLVGRSTG